MGNTYKTTLDLDGQGRAIHGFLPFKVKKRITFDGGTLNGIGDHDGTGDPFNIFTVTGDVLVLVLAFCKTTLVGAGTLEVGVANATASLLSQIADATTLAQDEMWGPDASPSLAEAMTLRAHGIGGGLDIIGTVGTANITAGVIDFYCFFRPMSDDGDVQPA